MVWELIGFSTEERGENAVRYRTYTTSTKTARLFDRIPRIDFTDSGHGIVFGAHEHRGKRKPQKGTSSVVGHQRYVDEHMARLRDEEKRAPRVRVDDLVAEMREAAGRDGAHGFVPALATAADWIEARYA
jgi:hypothetical protein